MEKNECITKQCIIEEYLNNWFTYEELAEYLCIELSDVKEILDNYCKNDDILNRKVKKHKCHIDKYYQTLKTGEEEPIISNERRITEIADYIISNKMSLRKTAQIFGLGKSTIFDYVHEKLPYISILRYKQVFDVLMANKSFSTNNVRVMRQVLQTYDYLVSGLSTQEIQECQHLSRNVVQRNLTTRLQKIDKEKYKIAKEILEENQKAPLIENSVKSYGK